MNASPRKYGRLPFAIRVALLVCAAFAGVVIGLVLGGALWFAILATYYS